MPNPDAGAPGIISRLGHWGRLGAWGTFVPEPQKSELRQTKIGNALTSAARWRGLMSIKLRPN